MVLKAILLGSHTLKVLVSEALKGAGGKPLKKKKYSFKFQFGDKWKTLEARDMLGVIEDPSCDQSSIITFGGKLQRTDVVMCFFHIAEKKTWNFKQWSKVLLQSNFHQNKSVVLVGIKDYANVARGSALAIALETLVEEFKQGVPSLARVNINVVENRNLLEAFYTATAKAAAYEQLKNVPRRGSSNASISLRKGSNSFELPRRKGTLQVERIRRGSKSDFVKKPRSKSDGFKKTRFSLAMRMRKGSVKHKNPFTTPLNEQLMTGDEVPVVLDTCLKFIMEEATHVESIFRKNGLNENIQLLKKLFSRNPNANLRQLKDAGGKYASIGPHDASSLLKLFLSELPGDPLINYDCYRPILDVMEASKGSTQFSDVKVCMRGLAATIECLMPRAHMKTLKHLCTFLQNFATAFVQHTKMDYKALAVCFAPVFFRRQEKAGEQINPVKAFADIKLSVQGTQMLITYANELFPSEISRRRRMTLRLKQIFEKKKLEELRKAHAAEVAAAVNAAHAVHEASKHSLHEASKHSLHDVSNLSITSPPPAYTEISTSSDDESDDIIEEFPPPPPIVNPDENLSFSEVRFTSEPKTARSDALPLPEKGRSKSIADTRDPQALTPQDSWAVKRPQRKSVQEHEHLSRTLSGQQLFRMAVTPTAATPTASEARDSPTKTPRSSKSQSRRELWRET